MLGKIYTHLLDSSVNLSCPKNRLFSSFKPTHISMHETQGLLAFSKVCLPQSQH